MTVGKAVYQTFQSQKVLYSALNNYGTGSGANGIACCVAHFNVQNKFQQMRN
jgi:hypothetical protein